LVPERDKQVAVTVCICEHQRFHADRVAAVRLGQVESCLRCFRRLTKATKPTAKTEKAKKRVLAIGSPKSSIHTMTDAWDVTCERMNF